MTLLPEVLALVTELLRKTLGSDVEVVECRIVNQHTDYYALLVRLRKPEIRLAVKLAGYNAPYQYPFERTAYFHQRVAAETSIPMPKVLAVDVSYEVYPWRYLIKTFIPGEEWAVVQNQLDPMEKADAYRQMGKAIAELHRIGFDGFGEVGDDGQSEGMAYFPALQARARMSIQQADLRERFLELLEARRDLFTSITEAHLCHEDLHGHNILFQKVDGSWRLATILDFDKAWAGHHEIDLARMEFWSGMTGEGFGEAYEQMMPISDGYEQRRPIYQLLWCLEYGANTERHLRDTQALCKTLNFPIVERFEERD